MLEQKASKSIDSKTPQNLTLFIVFWMVCGVSVLHFYVKSLNENLDQIEKASNDDYQSFNNDLEQMRQKFAAKFAPKISHKPLKLTPKPEIIPTLDEAMAYQRQSGQKTITAAQQQGIRDLLTKQNNPLDPDVYQTEGGELGVDNIVFRREGQQLDVEFKIRHLLSHKMTQGEIEGQVALVLTLIGKDGQKGMILANPLGINPLNLTVEDLTNHGIYFRAKNFSPKTLSFVIPNEFKEGSIETAFYFCEKTYGLLQIRLPKIEVQSLALEWQEKKCPWCLSMFM